MPNISKRGELMPASPIRKLVPYAEKAKQNGVKIYHLNIGQPDIITPAIALNAVRNSHFSVLEYSHSAGNESYRRKLANYYTSKGIDVDYNDLLITTGGSEAITFGLLSCLDAGDEIIIPEPFYANYNSFALAGNIVVKPITAQIENGFALPKIEAFEQLITPKTKAILICNPNNPTGYLYSKEELFQLKEIVQKHNLFLFADEVYRDFCYDNKSHFSILNLGIDENAIVIDSISKRYSACGARIGCIISKNKEVMNAVLKCAQARLSPPSFGQIVGEAAIDVEAEYMQNVHAEYDKRRKVTYEELNKIEGVLSPLPGGAFYTMAQLPIEDSDHFCQWMLESFQYNGETTMMAPGTGFYFTKGLGKKEVRIAYVLESDKMIRAIECLKHGLEAYKKR